MTKITLSRPLKIALLALAGAFVGAGLLFLYMLRFTTYLGDDPSACVNCHIMQPYYATWDHSSHKNVTTCNECHVPHENVARKYAFGRAANRVLAAHAGIGWSSGSHTALPTLTTAQGPGAEILVGMRDNADLGKRLKKLLAP